MTSGADAHNSVRLIQRRLYLLLARAFATTVVLTIILLMGLFALLVDSNMLRGLERRLLVAPLSAYYLGRGSWQGVEPLFTTAAVGDGSPFRQAVLLDSAGQVVAGSVPVGQAPPAGSQTLAVQVDGREVGRVVVPPQTGSPLRALAGLLAPAAFVSFFTGMATLLIGLLLTRRMVLPLAEVMAATRRVARGDLEARVPVEGPGDLRGLMEGFNHMAAALQRSEQDRRNLLADVAHELRTPLTVMRGRLEGIVDGVYPLSGAQIGLALEHTYLLERLVEDLRLLSLAEARQLHFDLQPVELGELARQAAAVFEAEAEELQVGLSVQARPNLPLVLADSQRVSQVIGNLLSNALRHAPEGSQVTLQVRPEAAGVVLEVSDSGPGVPEADLPRLFDRFWRADRSRGRAGGGAGLGLAIARQLIEAQGGVIEASLNPEGGLCLRFWLAQAGAAG